MRIPPPTVNVLGRPVSTFHVCGLVGWTAGIGLAFVLTARQGLPVWVTAIIAVAAIVTFLALVLAVKVATGEENIVYYHHEIALVTISALIVSWLAQPLLPYLDAVVMGLGLFLACGRLGCLMVGCCHGKLATRGVSYGPEHAKAGFAPYLVGVRLLPIQAVEAAFVAATVVIGSVLVLESAPPGTALVFYSIAYGSARFGFEWARGDTARPYWRGGSEAQWTSLAIAATVGGLSVFGPVPQSAWLLVSAVGMAAALAWSAVTDGPRRRLFRPRHVAEVAALLEITRTQAEATGAMHIGRTSLGLRISASPLHQGNRALDVFAFSGETDVLDASTARRLARLIARLRRADGDLTPGGRGVYHVVLPTPTAGLHEVTHAV